MDRVAVIGLGAGTLAAYGEPGRSMAFYEIDPAVVRIARDPALFTFVSDSRADLSFTIGDGRLEISKAADGSFGLIVVDAFTSDAIPVHLLTREALAIYMRKLRPGGIIALHLTNRSLQLSMIVDALTADGGFAGLIQEDRVATTEQLLQAKFWTSVPSQPGGIPASRYVWTDDYSSIFSVAALW